MNEQLDLLPRSQSTKRPRPVVTLRSAEVEHVGPATYRWIMRRAWSGGPTILWVLLNPSLADGRRDDPTTLRMIDFSARWGFGSMLVGNVYPFVSSTTDKLRAWRRTFDHQTFEDLGMPRWEIGLDRSSWAAFHHGMGVISAALNPGLTCVAAWGAGVPEADVDQLLRGVRPEETIFAHMDWWCLGENADGSPRHPLARGRNRVPNNAELKIWRKVGLRWTSPERYA